MKQDNQIFELIADERARQMRGIELIASENFVSEQVMAAMGSVLTNKYAEGYPAARYYGGCEVVDKVERLAIERLCELYGAEYANVQPHSGAQANMAVFFAVLQPGDHGSTYGGNPVSCAGALSVLERLDEEMFAQIKEKSDYVFRQLENAEGVEGVAGMGLMIGITAVAQWLMGLCNNRLTYATVRDIRRDAFRHLQHLPLSYLDKHPTGDVVSRIISDVDQFADGLLMGFTQLF